MKRLLRLALAIACLPVLALVVAAAREPLPEALSGRTAAVSLEVADRDGKLFREVRTVGGVLATPVRLGELSPSVVPALLAAEDARFYHHPGIDPLAMLRAAAQLVLHGKIVSGASTITQQLARNVVPRPRTPSGKLREMAIALRIEASLEKSRILEEYLSRVEFGPNLRGIAAASRHYFDKPPSALDLAEAATLVAIPRGPTLYDPRRSLGAVTRRRNRILDRMREGGLAPADAVERALTEPVVLHPELATGGTEHLVLGLASGAIASGLPAGDYRRIETTLDGSLEREVETLARRASRDVAAHDASALAVLVVDNASGDVLAYVGSPDYFAGRVLGANDGVRALRQPGSTLKPFVYAAAMQSIGMTAATLLPDVELTFPTPEGPYTPKDYDGRMHGPVRLRQALASSLNVPAVYAAAQVGPGRVLELLHALGFSSLGGDAAQYGLALALGDGEVRLSELTLAYATLARGGERVPGSLVRAAFTAEGHRLEPARAAPSRVLDPRTAAVLTDVLSDDAARSAAFGRDGALALPFPVAAKTGTSKGYRDNWAVGFTHEVTVGVWVGNFDGSPMTGSSGITGAGPLFHEVMLAAMRGRKPAPLVNREGLVDVEVCALSGERPGPDCAHRVHELFRPDQVPARDCTMHVTARIDPGNGLLAGPACTDAEERTFEAYPARYAGWAATARRPTLPDRWSTRCGPPPRRETATQMARITRPLDGSRYLIDEAGPERQEIVLAATPAEGLRPVTFVLDGRPLGVARAPFELPWRLEAGHHRLEARTAQGESSDPVTFDVVAAR